MLHLSAKLQPKIPQLSLILITFIWGGSFISVQYALNFSSPILFVALRFAATAIALSCMSWKSFRHFQAQELLAGLIIGCVIAIGYTTQTIGLQSISSSESAFLTALYVPLVPIFIWLIFKRRPRLMMCLGSGCSFLGLILLTGNGFNSIHFSFAQLITLCGATAIALEIILIGYFATRVNIARVTVLQLVFTSLLCFIVAPLAGETTLPQFNWQLITILLSLSIASAVIQLVMNWAQQYVESSQAAIIYAAEPVWATCIGRLAGERLPFISIIGGALIVIGILISELKTQFFKAKA